VKISEIAFRKKRNIFDSALEPGEHIVRTGKISFCAQMVSAANSLRSAAIYRLSRQISPDRMTAGQGWTPETHLS
jgi:hypothetical protein